MSRTAGVVLVTVLLAVAGCGESSGDGGSADQGKSTETTSAQASTGAVVQRFKRCVREAGAKLEREPPTTKDRISLGGAGNLPATYIGAVVWPNDAYADVWIADDAKSGAKTADRLNEAEANSQGVSEVEAAFNNGRAVSAPENNPDTFGNLSSKQTQQMDDCLMATNE
jgi:hypothetical protein